VPRDVAPLDLSNRAAVDTWLAEASALVASLHDDAADAAAPKGQRRHSRAYLRGRFRRGFHKLSLALAALDARPPTGAP
jgi:hypothetical protein